MAGRNIKKHNADWWVSHPEVARCSEYYKDGSRCLSEPFLPNMTVCYQHGGRAKGRLTKAVKELQEHAPSAVQRLVELSNSSDENVALKASSELLRHTGIGERALQINVQNNVVMGPLDRLVRAIENDPKMWVEAAPEPKAIESKFVDHSASLQEAYDAEHADPDWGDVVEGEVVDGELVSEPDDRRRAAYERNLLDRMGLL